MAWAHTFLNQFSPVLAMEKAKEKISIIIPVFNEEKTVAEVIDEVLKIPLSGTEKEIIVVNDGSVDRTREVLDRYTQRTRKNLVVLQHPINKGKGAAIRTAISRASGDIILIQDADLEYHPKEYPKLLSPILKKKSKVVYGSRIDAIKKNLNKMYLSHYLGNRFLSLMTSVLYGQEISDMETGYKVFRKEVVNGMMLRSRRFDIEPEITAKILKRGYDVLEVPIDFFGRSFKEGKKITWIDGLVAFWVLVKYRFVD